MLSYEPQHMSNISRTWALLLIGVIAFSCLSILSFKPADAQTIPKPSVPEFTVQYVSNSQYVQPSTTTDPYTGQTTTQGGYYTQSEPYIKITIKNQPFTKYFNDSINQTIGLFFQVQGKGHFSQNWVTITYWLATAPNVQYPTQYPEEDYNSQNTTLEYASLDELPIPSQGQMDFQVQAGIGTLANYAESGHMLVNLYQPDYVLTGETSDWSNIQTITLPDGSVSLSTNPIITPISPSSPVSATPTPTSATTVTITPSDSKLSNEQSTNLALVAVAILGIAVVSLLVYIRKNKSRVDQPSKQ